MARRIKQAEPFAVMKSPIVLFAFLAILAPLCSADKQPADQVKQYRSYRDSGEKATAVIQRLEMVVAVELKIAEQPLSQAIPALQSACLNRKEGGVINFVIRSPRQIQDARDNNPPITTSLEAKNISFAAALDALCTQAKVEWSIEFVPDGGLPLLVIKPKEGVPNAAGDGEKPSN